MTTIDALTESEAKAQLAAAVDRLKRIAASQRKYYLKNKEKICKQRCEGYDLRNY